MKIKEISLSNFSKYDKVTVSFDENVTYLVGRNGSGKTTLGITGIHFIMQGIAENATGGNDPLIGERFRFIGPNGPTAKGAMVLYDEKTMAEIKVLRKLTKTGTELSFEGPEGLELNQKWLTDLFNIFLIAPKKFTELSPKEQANALGIDTAPFDKEIAALKAEHTAINREIKAIDVAPVEKAEEVDVKALIAQKEDIRTRLNDAYRMNQATNKATREAWEAAKKAIDDEVKIFNDDLDATRAVRSDLTLLRDDLQNYRQRIEGFDNLVDFSGLREQIGQWIKEGPREPKIAIDLYPKAPTNLADMPADYEPAEDERVYIVERPDDKEITEIDLKIFNAGETNKKALLYKQYEKRLEEKAAKEKLLQENKTAQATKEEDRLAYIRKFKFPFSNLTVGDDGELLLAGKPIKEPYFSTGEILKVVPILLSTSNPDLKYVFLQDFNLMDEDKQKEIADYLTGKGFQLVVEMVGKAKIAEKNCILLKDNVVVEDYQAVEQPALSL
jgi:hypothetical protein